ncbi:MAG TPA: DUF1028 domain-containing protein [Bacteroidales bacterium]|jgi:uncharacterized Ntn-hydrolase superfamily protein|nr:DUF1028 domain-containing protein [Bacteroidales bacterium]
MKARIPITLCLIVLCVLNIQSQDTFSIVAIDTVTGEVGSAGASCVNLNSWPGMSDDFLGELFPDIGAINTQAYYHQTNQANARNRMNLGDTPSQIIQWLVDNDVSGQPQLRQYGIVAFVDGSPESAAHTGVATDDYKNHVLGRNYSIQGNILLGQIVLDSMESNFINADGDLACKLMAALQGANMIGADTRCASNGSSSLFAFLKVAQPDDEFGDPSFLVSLRTVNGDGIEPIDSLQVLFDAAHTCTTTDIIAKEKFDSHFLLYPNPVEDVVNIEVLKAGNYELEIVDIMGNQISSINFEDDIELDISFLPDGIYFVRISNKEQSFITKIIKAD